MRGASNDSAAERRSGGAGLVSPMAAAIARHLVFVGWGATLLGCGRPASQMAVRSSPPVDSVAARQAAAARSRDSTLRSLAPFVAGRDSLPAEAVFSNVRNFRGMRVNTFLSIMNGFGASLGTTCEHCHLAGNFADESKPTKQIAREMGSMVARLQRELLRPMPSLQGRSPTVTCFTCHNGQPKPRVSPPKAQPADARLR